MRIVIQRVREASVEAAGELTGKIGPGLAVLVGIAKGDTLRDAEYLLDKLVSLRIFADETGKMNRDLLEVSGDLLIVSQFTLYGDCRKGRRPSFDAAAPPEDARRLYEHFVARARSRVARVETGVFQAYMRLHLVNDGPVTIICESAGL